MKSPVYAAIVYAVICSPCYGQQATATERYMLQERCGKLAAEVFAKEYPGPKQTDKDGMSTTVGYQNHYSAKLNKCFFLERTTFFEKGTTAKLLRLFDLNENKEYGSYWEFRVNPVQVDCVVGQTRCKSEEEWMQLAKPYLED